MIHLNFETTLDYRKISDEQYSKNTQDQDMKRDLNKLTKGDVHGNRKIRIPEHKET